MKILHNRITNLQNQYEMVYSMKYGAAGSCLLIEVNCKVTLTKKCRVVSLLNIKERRVVA